MSLNKHSPVIASGTVSVTGTEVVDTGLTAVADAMAVLKSPAAATGAFVDWSLSTPGPGQTVQLTINVLTDAYIASSTAVDVTWTAFAG